MCLIVFDWRPDTSDGPIFTVAANRDEFFQRTTDPMNWWADAPHVLAGRDRVGGGTWLGMTRDGRFAALTNYRAPHETRADAPTRGTLVSNWLTGNHTDTPLDYLQRVAQSGALYNGFNLLAGDWTRRELGWYLQPPRRRTGAARRRHARHFERVLDTRWPKLVRKRDELHALLAHEPSPPPERLIDLMRDPQLARDDELPATGLPLERERALSAAFIETPGYGTRGTTALQVSVRDGRFSVIVAERSDDNGSHRIVRPGHVERRFEFDVGRRQASGV